MRLERRRDGVQVVRHEAPRLPRPLVAVPGLDVVGARETGRLMAHNLHAVASALEAHPVPAPGS